MEVDDADKSNLSVQLFDLPKQTAQLHNILSSPNTMHHDHSTLLAQIHERKHKIDAP
jgi:hypothetical protein